MELSKEQLSKKMKKVRAQRIFNLSCPDGSFQGWASQPLRNLAGNLGVKNRGRMLKKTLCEKLSPWKKGDPEYFKETGEWNKWEPFDDLYSVPYSTRYIHRFNPKYVKFNNEIQKRKIDKWTKRARDANRLGQKIERIEPEDNTINWIKETGYKKPKKEYVGPKITLTDLYNIQEMEKKRKLKEVIISIPFNPFKKNREYVYFNDIIVPNKQRLIDEERKKQQKPPAVLPQPTATQPIPIMPAIVEQQIKKGRPKKINK